MSAHGWAEGDKAVVESSAGGHYWYKFGAVTKCTPATIKLAFFQSIAVTEHNGPAESSAWLTCRFDTPATEQSETYRWLPSRKQMGKAQRASLCSLTVRHFDPTTNYHSVQYL